jgi:4-amino-4-deoxy-L-arabinose transferase-like glycosyltransferase
MSKRVLPAALLSLALLAGVALRLWNLGQTSWQFDEIVYHQIATNVLQHGLLAEKIVYRQSYEPFLYQPPWYLHLLAGWFWLTRPTIYSARLLGVIFSTCSLAMIWLLMRRLAGARAASSESLTSRT